MNQNIKITTSVEMRLSLNLAEKKGFEPLRRFKRPTAFRVVCLVHTIVEIKGRWQHREVPTNPLISAFSEPEY